MVGQPRRFRSCQPAVSGRAQAPSQHRKGDPPPDQGGTMPKLMRAFVLGAMLAVLSAATAAVAQAAPQFRAGERSSQTQPASDRAVQQFRAGERSSQTQPAPQTGGSSLAQAR